MKTGKNMQTLLIALCVGVALLITPGNKTFAGGGNPEGGIVAGVPVDSHLEGPQIVGSAILTYFTENFYGYSIDKINFFIEGNCTGKGKDIKINITQTYDAAEVGFTREDFQNAEDVDIEGLTLLEVGPPDCYSEAGGEDVNITQVGIVTHETANDGIDVMKLRLKLNQVVAD